MEVPTYIRNIAIVGAAGNLGSLILKSLLSAKRFNITAITRGSSSSVFPTDGSITIQKGDYDSPAFLHAALTGHDALVLVLQYAALVQPQMKLIEAAAAAGVKWILPTEYGTDSAHPEITNAVPFNAMKVAPRLRLEELARTHQDLKWIGVITNIWFDFALTKGFFKIDVQARTATLLDEGHGRFNTTTKSTVALAVARLLSLPEKPPSPSSSSSSPSSPDHVSPSLSDFGNTFCYISSFLTSQAEILAAVQRVVVTETTTTTTTTSLSSPSSSSAAAAEEWTVEHVDTEEYIRAGKERVAKGDFGGAVDVLTGMVLGGGGRAGADYESVKGTSNGLLGLPEEGLEEAVREALFGGGS